MVQCLPAIRFLFLDFTCFIAKDVLSYKCVFPNIECIFSGKSIFAEFIAPDVFFKTTNARAPKKQRLIKQVPQQWVSSGPYLLI